MPLMAIEEASPSPAKGRGESLFPLGFRPIYLLAAAFTARSVPSWIRPTRG